MSETRDLLIEIGTEELPPKALRKLSNAFASSLKSGLQNAELNPGECKPYAAPRRLAVLCRDVAVAQADREVTRRGPAVASAFDDKGEPTKAVMGFARSCGVDVKDLQQVETDKGAYLVFEQHQTGSPASELVPQLIEKALATLPIPKRMRWGAGEIEFLRPVHWVTLLFGKDVIDAEILGIKTGRTTRGHRFHHPEPISLANPSDYVGTLEKTGRVVVDMDDRRERVRSQADSAGKAVDGQALIDPDLLDEVANLVEWPIAVIGDFDREFLRVPREALISSMQDHQKYFPIENASGELLPKFITIANIESSDFSQIKAGNERVIRPRLSDAAFFWEQDLRKPLAENIDKLSSVVFQKKLGSLADKSERVGHLAATICAQLGGNTEWAQRASLLSRCDLVSAMVNEFPDLQGIMGRYYATASQEPEEVASAIDEQYMPRFAGDELPSTKTGQSLAIAERLDTLAGIFALGQIPTGDKDPFALRRAAIGTLRILIEKDLDLDLHALLQTAVGHLSNTDTKIDADLDETLFQFMLERLRAYYADQGIAIDSYDAVLACRPVRPRDFDQRVRAVTAFRERPECASLAAANKRIRNILKKNKVALNDTVQPELMESDAERVLASQLSDLRTQVEPLLSQANYDQALIELARLKEPVDQFFDEVMVMAEDPSVKTNRLTLISGITDLFMQIADVSRLQITDA